MPETTRARPRAVSAIGKKAVFEDGVRPVAEISENAEAAADGKDAAGEDCAGEDQSGVQTCVEELAEMAA